MELAEKMEHYSFYIDNCTDREIPLSYKEWEREIYPDLLKVYKKEPKQ